jgi:hypothetical protein
MVLEKRKTSIKFGQENGSVKNEFYDITPAVYDTTESALS